jgi:hypothetical protein
MTEDPQWSAWSGETLAECAETPALAINPLIYAEVSIRFDRIEELEDALPEEDFLRLPLPWEAAFLRRRSCSMRRISSGYPKQDPLWTAGSVPEPALARFLESIQPLVGRLAAHARCLGGSSHRPSELLYSLYQKSPRRRCQLRVRMQLHLGVLPL